VSQPNVTKVPSQSTCRPTSPRASSVQPYQRAEQFARLPGELNDARCGGSCVSVLATRGSGVHSMPPGIGPQRRKAEAIGRWSERVPALCVWRGPATRQVPNPHFGLSSRGKVVLGVGYLIEGTHAQHTFESGLRTRRNPDAHRRRRPDRRPCIRDLSLAVADPLGPRSRTKRWLVVDFR
jgi:hypothetical protein